MREFFACPGKGKRYCVFVRIEGDVVQVAFSFRNKKDKSHNRDLAQAIARGRMEAGQFLVSTTPRGQRFDLDEFLSTVARRLAPPGGELLRALPPWDKFPNWFLLHLQERLMTKG